MIQQNTVGSCRTCGVNLVDWPRVHLRTLEDVDHTFQSLKKEMIRHFFWHLPLGEKAVNHARRKGKTGLRVGVRHHLESAIAPAAPFNDGHQTPMPIPEEASSMYPYAQHATATCCRTCLEYWHGIPKNRALIDDEIEYLTELVCHYIEDRIPTLTEDGEDIPPIRKQKQ